MKGFRFFPILISLLLSAFVLRAQDPPRLQISRLTSDYYVYTTWNMSGSSLFPSNGLYVVTNAGVILIDSPWDTTQFQPLLDTIQRRHGQKVVMCIATHFHDDRTAGLDFYRKHGAKTLTSKMTDHYSRQAGAPRAEFLFDGDTTLRVGNVAFEVFYPGEGHSRDNVVVWFPKKRVLYGGCLIKSTEAKGLGNLSDANVGAWPATMQKLLARYPKARFMVPGHQGWSGDGVRHTIELLSKPRAGQ